MPPAANDEPAKSKSDMIREVLDGTADLPATEVQATVWERFGGEVTAREIARERKKLRQADASGKQIPSPAKPRVRAAAPVRKRGPAAPRQKPGGPVRAKDFMAADVTVKQLSAILEAAE